MDKKRKLCSQKKEKILKDKNKAVRIIITLQQLIRQILLLKNYSITTFPKLIPLSIWLQLKSNCLSKQGK